MSVISFKNIKSLSELKKTNYIWQIKNDKDNNLYSKEVFKGNLDCLYVSIKKDLDIKWGYIYAKIN